MNSDGYVEEEFDQNIFAELDAIEAAHHLPPNHADQLAMSVPDESYHDLSFDVDESELQRIDGLIEDTYAGMAGPAVRPNFRTAKTTRSAVQTTLFGDVLAQRSPPKSSGSNPRAPMQKTKSATRNPFGQQAPKTKQWDQTAFAKSGLKRGKTKDKRKSIEEEGEVEEEDENIEFDQFPAPFVSGECSTLVLTRRSASI
jgi:ATP-dependent DNA helicase MPH1